MQVHAQEKTKEGQTFLLPNLLNCFVVKFNRNSFDEGLDIIVACFFPVLNQKEISTHKMLVDGSRFNL